MELVKDIALTVFSLAFIASLLTTVFSGSGRFLKILLLLLTGIFLIVSIAGFYFTSGWLIFLYTQLIVLWLIIYGVIITGAVTGGGIYLLIHQRRIGDTLNADELADFLPLQEFCALENLTEDRTLGRIRSRYYRGGKCNGTWYIHKSELSAISSRD